MDENNKSPVRQTSPPPKSLSQIREDKKKKKREAAAKPKKSPRQFDVRFKKIPLALRPILVSLHNDGMSYRAIAKLLNDAYGIKVSRHAVYYHIKRFRMFTQNKS